MMTDVPNVLNHGPEDQPPADPRLLLSEPFRAVHFVYGLFHPDVRPLSGRALVGALAALGFRDEAARGMLLRLRRAGFLESRRTGREAVYTVSPRSRELLDEMAKRSTEPPPPWGGRFETLLVQIPPAERAFREQLRRHAVYAGFAAPLPGMLIAPYASSPALLEPLLARRPRAVRVVRGRLAVDPEDAAVLARGAWDLETLATDLRHEAQRMNAAATAAQGDRASTGADAITLLWRSIGPFFSQISASPPLPSALLPADWPLDAAREAFFRLAMSVALPAREFVEDLDRTHPSRAAIARPDPEAGAW